MTPADVLAPIAAADFADKRSRPIWLQIYDRLATAFDSEAVPEGAKLPGEDELAKLFGVTRLTLRRALDRHQREGRLVARKGVGIFVRAIAVRYVVRQHEAFNDSRPGGGICTRPVSLRRRAASSGALSVLGIAPGAEVIELQMLNLLGETPVYFAIKEFPAAVVPDFEADFARHGDILAAFAAAGIDKYLRAETRIVGDFAGAREKEMLNLSLGAPVLRSRSFNTDLSGRPIEYNRGCWPMFSVELVFGERPEFC